MFKSITRNITCFIENNSSVINHKTLILKLSKQNKYSFLSTCFLFVFISSTLISIAPQTVIAQEIVDSDGDGISDDDDIDDDNDNLIEIRTLIELDDIRNNLTGQALLGRDQGCQEICQGFELVNDLDFDSNADGIVDANDEFWHGGLGWQPIGLDYDNQFTAKFNGNGFVIRHLTIKRPTQENIGLFGNVGFGAEIKDLGLEKVYVWGKYGIGAITGRSSGALYQNTYSIGYIQGMSSTGGLIGYSDSETINNVYHVGRVYAPDGNVGGIIGDAEFGQFSNFYNIGPVTGSWDVGGLFGTLQDSEVHGLTNGYSVGLVTGNGTVGGIVGDLYTGKITNVYSIAKVSGYEKVGAIAGLVDVEGFSASQINNSYWLETSAEQGIGRAYKTDTTISLSDAQIKCPQNAGDVRCSPVIFSSWDDITPHWNFGNSTQYPSLFLGSENYQIGDFDNDGVNDNDDYFPSIPIGDFPDEDGDGIPDECNAACLATGLLADNDADFDGITDALDIDDDNNDLIEIRSLADLNEIRNNLTGTALYGNSDGCFEACYGFELVNDLNFDTNGDGVVNENDDYWNDGLGWQPLGDTSNRGENYFISVFEGNGFSIDNLTINRPDQSYIGLFGATDNGAEIYDLHLTQVRIIGSSETGGLAGDIDYTYIENVSVTGSVSGVDAVGGLVGYSEYSSIYQVSFVGRVFGAGDEVAGIFGCSEYDYIDSVAHIGPVTGNSSVGGILGCNYSTVRDVYSAGVITGDDQVGGIAAYQNDGSITRSLSSSEVVGNTRYGAVVGWANGIGNTIESSHYKTGTAPSGIGQSEITDTTVALSLSELTCPQLPGDDSCSIISYSDFSEYKWNFGDSNQLPALSINDQWLGINDYDQDGVDDSNDYFPSISHGSLIDTDNDGVPNNCDESCLLSGLSADNDDDNDGIQDSDDAFPLDASESVDSDGDGVGDNADAFPLDAKESADSDGDGVGDNADDFPLDSTESVDTDGDGIGNNADTDDDNDGIDDNIDQCTVNSTIGINSSPANSDFDNDGCDDITEDLDTDGDGINEVEQIISCTLNVSQDSFISSGNIETNYGDRTQLIVQHAQSGEYKIYRALFQVDIDDKQNTAELCIESAESLPSQLTINSAMFNVYIQSQDYAVDMHRILDEGAWQENEITWENQPDFESAALHSKHWLYDWTDIELTSQIQSYIDGNDVNNGWMFKANDESAAEYNPYRFLSRESGSVPTLKISYLVGSELGTDHCGKDPLGSIIDTDNDGLCDGTGPDNHGDGGSDTDDDNDGYENDIDVFPLDSTESVDTDGDGIGNNGDTDDDNDGVDDLSDAFPLDSTESVDTDGDGIGNNADTDDDNDGIVDEDDSAPLDSLVGDNQAPVIGEIESLIVEATAELTVVELVTPTVTDNNLNQATIVSDLVGALALGEYVITWTATDYAGNQATKTQAVSVVDTTAPMFDALGVLTLNAQGRLTDILAYIDVVAIDVVDGELSAELVGDSEFISGRHEVTLDVTDLSGNRATALLTVDVLPEVSISAQRHVEAGGTYHIAVMLSGEAANYPVDVLYNIALNNEVYDEAWLSITSGTQSEIVIEIASDLTLADSMSISLEAANNGFIGEQYLAELTLIESNVAPLLDVVISQGGENFSVVDPDNGVVILTASISDVNQGNTHDITWSVEDNAFADQALDSNALTFEIEPNALEEGVYSVDILVTENNTDDSLSVSQNVQFVVEQLTALGSDSDSDGDGIVDSEEGYSDSDGDGIADYLDDDSNTTRLPSSDNTEPMQTSPGLTMSLGSLVASQGADSDDASLTVDDLAQLVGDDAADTQDIHFDTATPLYNFTIAGLAEQGDAVAVVIPLESGTSLPADAVYRKYNTTQGWFVFVEDANNSVSSALADENGNCPAANDDSYSLGLTEGNNCIQLVIEDGGPNDADFSVNGSVEDPGAVVIEKQNQAPVISIDSHDATAQEGTMLTLISQGSDPEEDAITYQWQQVSGPAISFDDNSGSQVTITLPEVTSDEVIEVQVTVSDGDLSTTAITSFTVTNTVEVIKQTSKKSSGGGAMGWLFILAVVVRLRKSMAVANAA